MQTVQKMSTVFLTAAVLFLSGCSTTGGSAKNSSNSAQKAGEDGAQSYALQQKKGYTGQIRRNQNGQIINPMVAPANQTYYFTFNSNSVGSQDYKAMALQANYLVSHPKAKVRLEGNADDRGSREYNVGLGWRRDQSVAQFLKQHGVMQNQIDMVSYGKERPAVIGDNDYAWRLNRRVKLVYEAY